MNWGTVLICTINIYKYKYKYIYIYCRYLMDVSWFLMIIKRMLSRSWRLFEDVWRCNLTDIGWIGSKLPTRKVSASGCYSPALLWKSGLYLCTDVCLLSLCREVLFSLLWLSHDLLSSFTMLRIWLTGKCSRFLFMDAMDANIPYL